MGSCGRGGSDGFPGGTSGASNGLAMAIRMAIRMVLVRARPVMGWPVDGWDGRAVVSG